MEAKFERNGITEGIIVLKGNDDNYYSYDSNERWNGEYYKGWKSNEYGEAVDDEVYKVNPINVGIGEEIEDGVFEAYEIGYYIVERY